MCVCVYIYIYGIIIYKNIHKLIIIKKKQVKMVGSGKKMGRFFLRMVMKSEMEG